jgi:16S rRNA (adenine(1408)-N(1))-methyltransferase
VIADLGTGDGRFVLATAAAHPSHLVLGIDADAATMAVASRRAARPAGRGGRPNALFAVAAAEALPGELDAVADRVTINLPWGSLLRGALGLDRAAADGIARLVAPGGRVEILVAPAPRDRLAPAVDVADRLAGDLAAGWAVRGLTLADARPATATELAATRSSWLRRLGLQRVGSSRQAWRLVLVR